MNAELSRRHLLKLLLATGAAGGVGWLADRAFAHDPRERNLLELTATEAVSLMLSGRLRAEAYAEALLERAQSLASLNALISQDPDRVLEAAREADRRRRRGHRLGPLHGLPVLIKDNINTMSLPTTGGTPALAGNHPPTDAAVVTALQRAGALVFGKTNMHELAFGITSNNAAFGPVRNPYDPSLIPGGSSGGNGAAVAARFAPASIGTDTGGSTRIPAALCGIVGFRPTIGRYPGTGTLAGVGDVVPISHTRDTPGPMARSVADVALLDTAITGTRPRLRRHHFGRLRLGVARGNFFENLDSELEMVVDEALGRLEDHGIVLVEVDIPDLAALNAAVGFPVALFEAGVDLPVYLAKNAAGVTLAGLAAAVASPDVNFVLNVLVLGGAVPEAVYLNALNVERPKLQAAYRQVFEDFGIDALVFPTTPLPARPIGQDLTVELNGVQVPTFQTYIRHTDPGANAGIPGLSVPAGVTRSGLPVGLELDGPVGSDGTLLAIGFLVEEILGPVPAPAL